MIGWTRRSRAGWAWHDFVDAPLGEEFERYRLRVLAGGAVLRTVVIESCTFSYDAALASADTAAAGGEPLLMEIVQLGSRGISKPLRSEEHTSELQSLMRTSSAVFSLKQ